MCDKPIEIAIRELITEDAITTIVETYKLTEDEARYYFNKNPGTLDDIMEKVYEVIDLALEENFL